MRALPLFHRLAGQPVIVLGAGAAAEAKRRLVERAGGQVLTDLAVGIASGARLGFVAHDDEAACIADAERLRSAGLLINVVDRPELCDFTVPSLLERDPVLLAVGTAGASAGLAKQLRLALERLLPADLGALASTLETARAPLRARWPNAADRRRALDQALTSGGALDPMVEGSAARVAEWIDDPALPAAGSGGQQLIELTITSDDPDDLTLRQARWLGVADYLLCDPGIAPAILDRARADAVRLPWPAPLPAVGGLVLVLRRA